MALHVALVGRDPTLRALAAETFDHAPASWRVTIHEDLPPAADVIVDLSGDLGDPEAIAFDASAPRSLVDEIARRASALTGPIGVWSPCPGSGATSVAIHLAATMAHGDRCVLVDLDPARGAAIRMACPPLDPDVTDAELRARPVSGGFRLLEGDIPASGGGRVIIDGPAARVCAAGCAKHVIVLPSGRAGLERSLPVLERLRAPSALVVNRTGWGGELTRHAIGRILGRRIALELPFSPGLRDAEDRGVLLSSPVSPWLYRVRRLARAL